MICINCSAYYRSSAWNNTRFCNSCCQFDNGKPPDQSPTDEDLADEISRLQEDHGTSKIKPVFYSD